MSAKGVLVACPPFTGDFYHRHFINTSQSRVFSVLDYLVPGLGVRLGIQNLAAKAEDKEQLFDTKRFASAARDSLLDVRGVAVPPARSGGLRSFPGAGLPQQTVASVDHTETPQQFDKMATADLLLSIVQ